MELSELLKTVDQQNDQQRNDYELTNENDQQQYFYNDFIVNFSEF